MHTGLVRYQGRKMSKSLGNLVVVRQALERAPAAAVRLYLAAHRYRRDWTFRWQGLDRMARFCARLRPLVGDGDRERRQPVGERAAEFVEALSSDLDSPRALRALRAAVRDRDAVAASWMLGILAGTAALT
jgi:cysteinyl-tRNA synthetase